MRRFLTLTAIMLAMPVALHAQVWAPVSRISETVGNERNRLCMGGGREFVGCPSYAPSLTTGGHVSITGNVSANRFIGDGSGLTGVAAATGDRIVSGSTGGTRMVAISETGYISITQANANTGWFDPTRGLVTLGVSATGPISGTHGYFSGNVGIGTANPLIPLHVVGQSRFTGDMSFTNKGVLTSGAGVSDLQFNGNRHWVFNMPNGGVGVNTQSPTATLQVSGSFIVSTSAQAGTSASLFVGSNGLVGVGTSNPLVNLHVAGNSVPMRINSTNGNALKLGWESNGVVNGYIGAGAGAPLVVGSSGGHIRMYMSENGNLGISTTVPRAKLDVAGTISASDAIQVGASSLTCGAGIPGAIRYQGTSLQYCNGTAWTTLGSAGAATAASSTGAVQFNAGGTLGGDTNTFFWDNANKRLGIGTNTPSVTVHVYRPGGHHSSVFVGADAGYSAGIGLQHGHNGYRWIIRRFGSSDDMRFYNYGLERDVAVLKYDTGHMGIGTLSPTATLQVSGSFIVSTSAQTTTPSLFVGTNGRVGIGTTSPVGTLDVRGDHAFVQVRPNLGGDGHAYIDFGDGSAYGWQLGRDRDFGGVSSPGGFYIYQMDTGQQGPRFTISKGGNVGIATRWPSATLHVSGTVSATNAIQVGTSSLTCGAGIAGALRYSGSNIEYCNGTAWGALVGAADAMGDRIVSGTTSIIAHQDKSLTFTTNNQQRMVVGEDGRVGIGVSSPQAQLHMNGSAYYPSFGIPGQIAGLARRDFGAVMFNGATHNYPKRELRIPFDPASSVNARFDIHLTRAGDSSWGTTRSITKTIYLVTNASGQIVRQEGAVTHQMGTASVNIGLFSVDGSELVVPIQYNQTTARTNQIYVEAHGREASRLLDATISPQTAGANGEIPAEFVMPSTHGPFLVSDAIVVGQSSLTCGAGIPGAIRYQGTSLQYCNGTAWTTLGSAGAATAASSTGAVQFNADNALAGDTNNFFWDNASKRLGIGGGLPLSGTLHLRGQANTHALYVESGSGSYLSTPMFAVNSAAAGDTAAAWGLSMVNTNTTNNNRLRLGFYTHDLGGNIGIAGEIQTVFRNRTVNGFEADMFFTTKDTNSVNTEKMRITSAGNVGVGTPLPTATLQVSGTFIVSTSAQNLSPSLYVGTNGRIGLRTTSPSAWLHLAAPQAGIVPQLMFTREGHTRSFMMRYSQNIVGKDTLLMGPTNNPLFVVDEDNRVGIGTTGPLANLDVAGTISASDAIQVGSSSLTCGAGIPGAIRYNAPNLQFCNGTSWTNIGGGGGGLEDRLTSGTHAVTVNEASGVVSLSTGGTTWGYLNSTRSYLPALTSTQVSSTNVSATLLQVGTGNGATCSTSTKGAIRYSDTSSTVEYCQGSAWVSMGPSATAVPAFRAFPSEAQSIPQNTDTKVNLDTIDFDTYNNFDTGNGSFTPTVPGTYVLTANAAYSSLSANQYAYLFIRKNGSVVSQIHFRAGSSNDHAGRAITAIVQANGTTDSFDIAVRHSASSASLYSNHNMTSFSGALISMAGGGGGGGGGGSDNLGNHMATQDLDMGAHNIVGTGRVSVTNISATHVQLSSATTPLVCDAGLVGTMRYTSGTMQVCDGSAWGNIGIGVPTGTIAAFEASACPGGWSEYTASRGRFLRGIDTLAAGIDPAGTRAPGSVQEDEFKAHVHSYIRPNRLTDYRNTLQAGSNGNQTNADASTSSEGGDETRPKNVAVTFCVYSGFQSAPGQTILTTLASLTDVSVGGATPGQALVFDGASWIASNTAVGGGGLEDRIISGTHAVTVNEASGLVSLSTGETTWGYLNSTRSYLPALSSVQVSSTNVSATLLQVGTGNGAACDAARQGAMRYSTVSSTMEYCQGSAWVSMGPSATAVPAFSVKLTSAQNGIPSNAYAKIVWSAKEFDTHNNFNLGTGRFTPTVPGKYILTLSTYCSATMWCGQIIYKNGSSYKANWARNDGGSTGGGTVTVIVDANGTTDYFEAYAYLTGNTLLSTSDGTHFSGALISMAGGGGGSADNLGNHTATQDLEMGNHKATFGGSTGDKLHLYSNTIGVGIESNTFTQWSSSQFRWRTGGTSVSTGTQRMLLSTTGLTVTGFISSSGIVDVGTQVLGNAGDAVGAPTYSWTGNTGTGMYLAGANNIAFATGGTHRMSINGASVGIGTATPSTTFHVNGVQAGGFGANTTSGVLDFNDISNARSGQGQTLLRGSTASNPPVNTTAYWHPFSFEYSSKSGSGNLTQFAIPYTDSNSVAAGMFMRFRHSGTWTGWHKFVIADTSGNAVVANNMTAAAFLYSSDERLKQNVKAMTGGLAKVDALTPVTFHYTADAKKRERLGFIAQDVETVFPQAVVTGDDGMKSVDYPSLVPALVGAMKELKAENDNTNVLLKNEQALRAGLAADAMGHAQRIRELEAANDNLKAANDNLKAANADILRRLDHLESRKVATE